LSRRQSIPSNWFVREGDPLPPLFPEPADGDHYYNKVTDKLRVFIDGKWSDAAFGSGGGGVSSHTWNYDTVATMADPGSGKVRTDTDVGVPSTKIAFNILTSDGIDSSLELRTLKAGDSIYFQQESNANNWGEYVVSAPPSDNVTWFLLPVTPGDQSGSIAKNQRVLVRFTYSSGGGGGGGNPVHIVAGEGLTGGGLLDEDRTLAVNWGNTSVQVPRGNHTHPDYANNTDFLLLQSVSSLFLGADTTYSAPGAIYTMDAAYNPSSGAGSWDYSIYPGIYMSSNGFGSPEPKWIIGIVMTHNGNWVTQMVTTFTDAIPNWYVRQSYDTGSGRGWRPWRLLTTIVSTGTPSGTFPDGAIWVQY
jgi:hypothetical protein